MSTVLVREAVLPCVSVTVAVTVCIRSGSSAWPGLWPWQVFQRFLPVLSHCHGGLVCSCSALASLPSTTKRAFLTR